MRTKKGGGILDRFEDPEGERITGPRRAALTDVELAIAAADVAARSGDWSEATPKTLVGLYAWCHRATYGVDAAELNQKQEFTAAVRAAGRVLRDEFEEDCAQFAIFMRWAWRREKDRVDWAKKERVDRPRLGWRLLFSVRFVTDYRVFRHQAAR